MPLAFTNAVSGIVANWKMPVVTVSFGSKATGNVTPLFFTKRFRRGARVELASMPMTRIEPSL